MRQVSPALSSAPPAPDASPGRAQLDKVLDRFIVLKKAKEDMEATVQDARSKLKLAERLFAAKKRRWEAAQEPPRPAEAPEAVQGVVSHLRGRHRAEYSSAAVRVRRDRGRKGVAQSCLLPVHYGAARMRAPAPLHVGVRF